MAETSTQNDSLPATLSRDVSFWGMAATQFLGAFNDNLFKQVASLMCVDAVKNAMQQGQSSIDYQAVATALFALPFILFSGYAGYLADRTSKRWIVVVCKAAEIGIMLAGTLAIWSGQLSAVLTVLFLMGTHSAFFGPSKYGILPELVREKNLPPANGIFLMTTFLAIIFGMGLGGVLKARLPDGLGVVGGTVIGVAILGTLAAQLVRRTPVARPQLPFHIWNFFISSETATMFRRDRPLLVALLMYSVFWMLAGIVQQTVNSFAKLQLGYGDTMTGLLAASLALGIAAGCMTAGYVSRKQMDWRLVRWGSSGIFLALSLLGMLGSLGHSPEWLTLQRLTAWPLLAGLGFSTGMFTVPLQVFLQSRPPADQKGRVIGAMNLINWIAVFLAAGIYGLLFWGFVNKLEWPVSTVYAATAAMILPVVILYRPEQSEAARGSM